MDEHKNEIFDDFDEEIINDQKTQISKINNCIKIDQFFVEKFKYLNDFNSSDRNTWRKIRFVYGVLKYVHDKTKNVIIHRKDRRPQLANLSPSWTTIIMEMNQLLLPDEQFICSIEGISLRIKRTLKFCKWNNISDKNYKFLILLLYNTDLSPNDDKFINLSNKSNIYINYFSKFLKNKYYFEQFFEPNKKIVRLSKKNLINTINISNISNISNKSNKVNKIVNPINIDLINNQQADKIIQINNISQINQNHINKQITNSLNKNLDKSLPININRPDKYDHFNYALLNLYKSICAIEEKQDDCKKYNNILNINLLGNEVTNIVNDNVNKLNEELNLLYNEFDILIDNVISSIYNDKIDIIINILKYKKNYDEFISKIYNYTTAKSIATAISSINTDLVKQIEKDISYIEENIKHNRNIFICANKTSLNTYLKNIIIHVDNLVEPISCLMSSNITIKIIDDY